MKTLLQLSPRWEFPQNASPNFVETLIIYMDHNRLFVECIKERFGPGNPLDLDTLHGRELLVESTWPPYDGSVTAVATCGEAFFLKKPKLLDIAMAAPETIQKRILDEARVCEKVKKMPHPNLVEYKGCLVQDGKIKGLVLAKYQETLSSRVERPFDSARLLRDITSGVEHLHWLGIVHRDINPANIMLDAADNAVIIDFDSAYTTGHRISDGDKQGTPFFTTATVSAVLENDYYSVGRVKEFMEEAARKLDSQ